MKVIHLVLLLLLLNACAKPLQPDNYVDQISSTQLHQDTFQVSYRGSTNSEYEEASEYEKAIDLSLLRSAEVALGNGFNYFVIVKTGEAAGAGTKTTNTDGQVDGYLVTSGYEATSYGGNSYAHSNPGANNTIVCFKERPDGFAYVALFVKATLRAKYGLDQVAE